jgi:hypothetical protein
MSNDPYVEAIVLYVQLCGGSMSVKAIAARRTRNVRIPVLPDLWLPVSKAQREPFPVSN